MPGCARKNFIAAFASSVSPEPPENSFGGYAGSLALAGDRVIAAGFDGKLIALLAK